jgi:hypothetical protein
MRCSILYVDSLTSKSETKSVIDLTQEPVHINENKDLGDVEAINKDSIVVFLSVK